MSHRNSSIVLAALVAALAVAYGWIWVHQRLPKSSPSTDRPRAQPLTPVRRALSAADLAHGKQQLENMLSRRPAMRQHVKPGDEIYAWAQRQFAGEWLQTRVYWLEEHPAHSAEGDCGFTESANPEAFIRLRQNWARGPRQGEAKPFEELWCTAVFGLIDLRSYGENERLWEEALAGRLSREEWIRRSIARQLGIAQLTHDFYEELWAPFCRERSIACNPMLWYAYTPIDVDPYLSQAAELTDADAAWFEHWDRVWNEVIAPYRAANPPAGRQVP